MSSPSDWQPFAGSRPATEPSAVHRAFASALWQTFIALQAEGFNEQQALVIIGQALAANRPPQ